MITRVKRRLQRCLVGMVCALCTETFAQDVLYHATLAPRFGERLFVPYDLNDSGQVTGRAEASQWSRALLWDSVRGTLLNLGTLPGGSDNAVARGINNLSQVVGSTGSTLGGEAFLWDPASGMIGLGILPGYLYSGGGALNSNMRVCGTNDNNPSGARHEAFLWTPKNGMIGLDDLPAGDFWSGAVDINDSTQLTGRSHSAAGTEGFFWSAETGLIGIGDLPGGGLFPVDRCWTLAAALGVVGLGAF